MDYGHSAEISKDDERQEVWAKQRAERGFDDTELWNLDSTIAKFIHPRLVRFHETNICHPGNMTPEEWDAILRQMIFAFEFLASDDKYMMHDDPAWSKIDEGLKAFATYYGHLWN